MRSIWPSLIEAGNADEKLAVRALANPILAVEELGYTFTPEYRSQVEALVRFPPKTIEELASLKEKVNKLAGRSVDIGSPADLEKLLFKELKLPALKQGTEAQASPSKKPSLPLSPTAPLPYRSKWDAKLRDPLEELREAHPVMEPLLAYRQLEASRPHLATPEVYQKLKRGEIKTPFTKVKFRIRGGAQVRG